MCHLSYWFVCCCCLNPCRSRGHQSLGLKAFWPIRMKSTGPASIRRTGRPGAAGNPGSTLLRHYVEARLGLGLGLGVLANCTLRFSFFKSNLMKEGSQREANNILRGRQSLLSSRLWQSLFRPLGRDPERCQLVTSSRRPQSSSSCPIPYHTMHPVQPIKPSTFAEYKPNDSFVQLTTGLKQRAGGFTGLEIGGRGGGREKKSCG